MTVSPDGAPAPVAPTPPRRHSRLAIASCVVAQGMFFAFLVAVLYFQLGFQSATGPPDSDLLFVLMMSLAMVLPLPVHALGAVLGLVSLLLPGRSKVLPLVGIALNLLFALCSLVPWAWLALHAPGVK